MGVETVLLVSSAVEDDSDEDEDDDDEEDVGGCFCRALFFVLGLAVFSSVEICCGSNERRAVEVVVVDVTTPELPLSVSEAVVFDCFALSLMTRSVKPVIILKTIIISKNIF